MTKDLLENGRVCNLDPSVIALLEPIENNQQRHHGGAAAVTKSDIYSRIATIRLKQANIWGNSQYAAKVLEQALEEGSKDRTAHQLLGEKIRELELQVSRMSENDDDDDENEGEGDQEDGNDDAAAAARKKAKRLERELADQSKKGTALQNLLVRRMEAEMDAIADERTNVRERIRRLRQRTMALEQLIKPPKDDDGNTKEEEDADADASLVELLSPTRRAKLEERLAKVLEDQDGDGEECRIVNVVEGIPGGGSNGEGSSASSSCCVVCHNDRAVLAVIPCGHLCLCDDCTSTMTSSVVAPQPANVRSCPICRGPILSTLKVYSPVAPSTTTSTSLQSPSPEAAAK